MDAEMTATTVQQCAEADAAELRREIDRLRAEVDTLQAHARKGEERRRAMVHIIDDLNRTNKKLADQRKAMLHILVDYEQDRRRLGGQAERLDSSRRALLHILQDAHKTNLRLEDSRKAMIHIMGDLRDTTEQVQRREQELRDKQEQLAKHQAHVEALNERLQRAMTETHHRVKNNLQIIAAMIDMQTMDEMESVPGKEIRRLGSYVRTLAAVHDILTQEAKRDGEAHSVSVGAVLGRLFPLLQQTTTMRDIRHDVEDARLPARQGTSLALVANELVSNAIKHGRTAVEARFVVRDSSAILEVSDDGPGFPTAFDSRRAAHTGLELVEHLTRWDLDGKIAYENRPEGGARVILTIPLSAETASDAACATAIAA